MAVLRRERNTYRLPTGGPLRRELVRAARAQRAAVLHWIATGETAPPAAKGLGPLAIKGFWDWFRRFPGWDAFRLGARKMSERMTPILRAVWDQSARKFAPKVGLDPDEWSVVDPHTREMIERAALRLCESTLQTTSLAVDEAIRRTRAELIAGVVESGESVDQLTRRINKVFDAAETWRARRIAQTETARAVHAAQEQTAIASGVVAGWRWLLSEDACPLCQTVARRAPAVRLGQPFAVLSDDPDYGTVRQPPLHPHCNCTVQEILDVEAAETEWAETLHHPRPEPEDEDGPEPEDRGEDDEPAPAPTPPAPVTPPPPPPPPVATPAPAVVPPPPAPTPEPEPEPAPPPAKPPSAALDVQPTLKPAALRAALREAIDAIDGVHSVPESLARIPVGKPTNFRPGEEGKFFFSISGKPLRIEMHPKGRTPRMTMAHEFGHFIDVGAIPPAPGAAPRTAKAPHRDFDRDPRFRAWVEAVDRSDSVRSLRALKGQKTAVLSTPMGDFPRNVSAGHVQYLLAREETWARCYAQYIATRSGDAAMKAELDTLRDGTSIYRHHWSDDDFAPIARAMDGLFADLGWRPKP